MDDEEKDLDEQYDDALQGLALAANRLSAIAGPRQLLIELRELASAVEAMILLLEEPESSSKH